MRSNAGARPGSHRVTGSSSESVPSTTIEPITAPVNCFASDPT